MVVLLLPLSLAMDDGEFDNGGGGGSGGGGGGGVRWRWQRLTVAMDYGEAMVRGRWHSTVAVAGGGDSN